MNNEIEFEAVPVEKGLFDGSTLVVVDRCDCGTHVNIGIVDQLGLIKAVLTKEQALVLAEQLQSLARGISDGNDANATNTTQPRAHA